MATNRGESNELSKENNIITTEKSVDEDKAEEDDAVFEVEKILGVSFSKVCS